MEEILFVILQFVWELFWDIILQSAFQLVVEIIFHTFKGAQKTTAGPYLIALGYALLGGVVGIISLWLVPHAFIHHTWLRVINVLVTPLVVAELMIQIGRMRTRKGQKTIRLDTFGCAYMFALAMALVRLVGAK